MPGAAVLPLPCKFDALPSGETADIKCGDMKAETGVVGWLVYRIAPAAMALVDFGGTGQPDGKLGARMKFPEWRMRATRITRSRSTPLIAPPYRTRPVCRVSEMAGEHQLDEFGMRPDERHRRSRRPPWRLSKLGLHLGSNATRTIVALLDGNGAWR